MLDAFTLDAALLEADGGVALGALWVPTVLFALASDAALLECNGGVALGAYLAFHTMSFHMYILNNSIIHLKTY